MKLLLFSDLHLDTHFRWAGQDAARLRRRNLRATLTKIVELADELNVDALCCGGDLYEHERFAPGYWRVPAGQFRRNCTSPGAHRSGKPRLVRASESVPPGRMVAQRSRLHG